MAENVGSVEVDVDLDTAGIPAEAGTAGRQAGDQFQRQFNRSLRDFQRQGSRQIQELSQNMRRLGDEGEESSNRIRRSFSSLFRDTIDGLGQVRRRFLGLGVGLGPVLVPLIAILAEILPAIALLLPIIAAFAAGIAVVALSVDALGKAFKPLVEGFKTLKAPISAILTEGVRPLVQELTTGLIPVLRGGLGAFAESMNIALRLMLRFLAGAQGLRLVRQILFGLAKAIRPLLTAMVPLTRALLRITRAALPGFELLGTTISDLIHRFDTWIGRMADTGELAEHITNATETLIGVLKFLGNVFLGLNDAARIIFEVLRPVGELLSGFGISVREATRFIALAAAAFFGLFVPIASLISLVGSLGAVFTALGAIFSPIGLTVVAIVAALAALAAVVILAWQNSEAFREAVTNLGTSLFEFGRTLGAAILPALQAFWEFFKTQLLPIFKEIAAEAADNLAPAIQAIADHIEQDLVPAVVIIANKFEEWWPTIQKVIVFLVKLAGDLIKITTLIVGRMVPAAISAAKVMAGLLATAFRIVSTVITNVVEGGQILAGVLRGPLSTAARGARAVFNNLKTAVSGAMDVMGTIGGVIQSVIGFIGSLIDRVEDLISALGRIKVPDINLPGPGSILGSLNPFAHGGIIDRPTVALMGEGYRKEAVVPMTRPHDALRVLRASGLDKLVLNSSRTVTHQTTYAPTFNLYPTPGETPTAMMHRIDNRLRLRAGG